MNKVSLSPAPTRHDASTGFGAHNTELDPELSFYGSSTDDINFLPLNLDNLYIATFHIHIISSCLLDR